MGHSVIGNENGSLQDNVTLCYTVLYLGRIFSSFPYGNCLKAKGQRLPSEGRGRHVG